MSTKKYSIEIKVGIIMTLALVVFIWLFNYVKGLNILKPIHSYYAVYSDINGLQESNPVFLNGYKIGLVDEIHFYPDNSGRLVVVMAIEEDIRIPEDSRAVLFNADIMGTKAIRIEEGPSSGFLEYGDTIATEVEQSLMDQLNEELEPLKEKTERLIVSLDSVVTLVHGMLSGGMGHDLTAMTHDLRQTASHLKRSSYVLDTMLTDQKGTVQTMLAQVNHDLEQLDHILSNLSQVSDSLSEAELRSAINNLNSTLAQTALLMKRINAGEGSLGKLTTDDSLYIAIRTITLRLDTLVDKIIENPKKYIRVKLF